jgi:hypothetical protein
MNTPAISSNSQKNEIYRSFKSHCNVHGFSEENSSSLTLLVPAGTIISQGGLLNKLKKFLEGFECIIVVEPVIGLSDCLLKAGFKKYDDILPPFHVHVLIKEEKYEVRNLRDNWFALVGKSKKRLFHCEPVRETLSVYINYITKYWEEDRPGTPVFCYLIKKKEDKKEELLNCHDEPATVYSLLKKVIAKLVLKVKTSGLLSKFFISSILVLMSHSSYEVHSNKWNYNNCNQSNAPPQCRIN